MWVYDQFSPWYYDELSGTPGTSYVQSGNVVLALSGGAAQEWAGDYSQNVDVVLGIYSSTTQEFQAPGGPQAYTQAGNAVVLFYGDAGQTYIPPNAGQDGQAGNVVLVLSGGAYQDWRAGGNPGDVIQNGDTVVTLSGGGLQVHILPAFVSLVTVPVTGVEPYGSQDASALAFTFNNAPPSISRVTLTFDSTDPVFSAPTGPAGGEVFVEVALMAPGRVPLVSLSAAQPTAEFFLGQQGARFQQLSDAVEAGALTMQLRSYEALPGRTVPQRLGAGSLTVEALP
ncbi:MAG: hypothetical protein DYH20_01040 [Gammaproteobacteria bacterium PRO9]|nr:hypothetical protein [Gammaproteobacteria bacterium PRO9]